MMRRAAEIGVGATDAGHIRIVGVPPDVEARLRRELA